MIRLAFALIAILSSACGGEVHLGSTDGGRPDGEAPRLTDAGRFDELDAMFQGDDAAVELDAGAPIDSGPGDIGPVDAGPAPGSADLLVYTTNIENLETPSDRCPGDWQDLIYYMRREHQAPHIVLVQQITDADQLEHLIRFMSDQLGKPYRGVIAEANPRPFNSPCGANKAKQTNAIIYRADRLRRRGEKVVWRSYKRRDGRCVRDGLSRTRSVMQAFTDRSTGKTIAVASIHWSTSQESGPDRACATMNANETDQRLRDRYPNAALYIFGGDTNEPELRSTNASADYHRWYRRTNGDLGGALGWRDPIFDRCDPTSRKRCLLNNWTIGSVRRIDFLFFAHPRAQMPRVLQAHTVTYDQADQAARAVTGGDHPANYSDHRSAFARVRYRWP